MVDHDVLSKYNENYKHKKPSKPLQMPFTPNMTKRPHSRLANSNGDEFSKPFGNQTVDRNKEDKSGSAGGFSDFK